MGMLGGAFDILDPTVLKGNGSTLNFKIGALRAL
jgi:hypothetical protein